FQFHHAGMPAPHDYILKWPGPDPKTAVLDVYTSETQIVIQAIRLTDHDFDLTCERIAADSTRLRDRIVDVVDLNFDRHPDLKVTRTWPYHVGEKQYLVYLFEPERNQYVFNAELSALPGLTVDAKTKTVSTTKLDGRGGSEY